MMYEAASEIMKLELCGEQLKVKINKNEQLLLVNGTDKQLKEL